MESQKKIATKEDELKALEKIQKIVKDLGPNSYIGTAFDGCFEIAEENIRNDFGCSMKQIAEKAKADAKQLQSSVDNLTFELASSHNLITHLKKIIEREEEWKDYKDYRNVSQEDYEQLENDIISHELSDEKAKDLINDWYGFEKEKITILKSVPIYQINRHGKLREIGKAHRKAIYFASDYNYILFDCGRIRYELYNGELKIFL